MKLMDWLTPRPVAVGFGRRGGGAWQTVAAAGDFAARSAVALTEIDAGAAHLRTAGYAQAGDGGDALWRRTGTEPAHAGKVRSLDGAWWELVPQGGVFDVRQFGAVGDGTSDDTAAIQAALDAAALDDTVSAVTVPGPHAVFGTLSIPSGVTLRGGKRTGPYFPGFPLSDGAVLVRPAAGSPGPVVVLGWASAISGLDIRYERTGGGGDGIVQLDPATIVTYATVENVHILGTRTGDADGPERCIGLKFPVADSTTPKYFNRISNLHVTSCDVCIWMGNQANANVFTNIQTRESHVHYDLDGTGNEVIENVFSGLGLFSISGTITPRPVGFRLRNEAKRNTFVGYSTEMFGVEFDIDASSTGNTFLGHSNEPELSYAPEGNDDHRFARPVNTAQMSTQPLLTRTGGDRMRTGGGARFQHYFRVGGALPEINNPGGALTPGDADSKVIFRFGAAWTKTLMPSAFVRLRIAANRPFGGEVTMIEVDFSLRKRANTGNAMALDVTRADYFGANTYVRGLYFLTGASAGLPMGVALTGGGYGAFAFQWIGVDLEVTQTTFDSDARFFSDIHDLSATDAADVTAADAADAIDLLTLAGTDF